MSPSSANDREVLMQTSRDWARTVAAGDLDYNPSFSPDGRWIVFTSTRNESADRYRVGSDGARLEREISTR